MALVWEDFLSCPILAVKRYVECSQLTFWELAFFKCYTQLAGNHIRKETRMHHYAHFHISKTFNNFLATLGQTNVVLMQGIMAKEVQQHRCEVFGLTLQIAPPKKNLQHMGIQMVSKMLRLSAAIALWENINLPFLYKSDIECPDG